MGRILKSRSFSKSLQALKEKIFNRGNLPHISVEKQLEYIDELSQFSLGRVLIEKKNLDTLWTDRITTHCLTEKEFELEDFFLNRSPFVLAWKEALRNFQKIIQSYLKEDLIFASIPCGAMRELLELDFSSISKFKLIGIDIDPKSLFLAEQLSKEKGIFSHLELKEFDAWNLPYEAELDLISSCGLNIYISDRQKAISLYRQFWKSLKPNGKLVIGFLTYPPEEIFPSEWNVDRITPKDLFLEKVLYKDILDVSWRNFKTSEEFSEELRIAGFSEISIYYDSLHVYPIAIATK